MSECAGFTPQVVFALLTYKKSWFGNACASVCAACCFVDGDDDTPCWIVFK